MAKKLTTQDFIEKANAVHGDKYDYSMVQYDGSHTKVKIICTIHGEFEQKPNDHLCGKGCKECAFKATSDRQTSNLSSFIEKANIVHNTKYNYSKSEYQNNKTKIIIVCSIHGDFEQTPNNHLYGYGCSKCGIDITNNKNTHTTEIFVSRSIKVHNDMYDYSLVEYIDNKTPVKIICKQHGIFEQKPVYHINYKSGCPQCKFSKAVIDISNLLNNKVNYIKEYRFENCKLKKPLPFDFYIDELNLCIEYDGEQHFKAVEYWGGEESFKRYQLSDSIKTQYCIDKNINLLRIKYDEDHVSVLKEYFKHNFNIEL